MPWDGERTAAERVDKIDVFVDTRPSVRWTRLQRIAVATAVFSGAQLLPAAFLVAMWNKDRLGVAASVGAADVLALGLGIWFVLSPRSFFRAAGRSQYPATGDPSKWNPWLGGGG